MIEQFRNEPKEEFESGDLVKLRDDISARVRSALAPQIVSGAIYRVTQFRRNADEGGATVWIEPVDEASALTEALPIATRHLQKIQK